MDVKHAKFPAISIKYDLTYKRRVIIKSKNNGILVLKVGPLSKNLIPLFFLSCKRAVIFKL